MKNHLILLHGALGAKTQFEPIIPLISEMFYIHRPNFKGHGSDTFTGSLSIELFVKDMKDYMDRNDIDKCNIFGYSMGGYVALILAALYPERVNAIITLGTKWKWNQEIASKEAKMLNPEVIVLKVPEFADILKIRHSGQGWQNLLNRTAELMIDLGNSGGIPPFYFKKIQIPVLICLGSEDRMVSVEESHKTASLISKAEFKILEGVPHPFEKVSQELLAGVIKQFLE